MFLDASVIVAILADEPGHQAFEARLDAFAGSFYVSPLVRFEASVALARHHAPIGRKPTSAILEKASLAVDAFFADLGSIEIEISEEIGRGAIEAAQTYGKAVGHRAAPNFGDCFAYACPKAPNVPLFHKGENFAMTDLA